MARKKTVRNGGNAIRSRRSKSDKEQIWTNGSGGKTFLRDQRPFPFTSLPTEMRYHVYMYLFHDVRVSSDTKLNGQLRLPGFLRTSRRIFEEAVQILCQEGIIEIKLKEGHIWIAGIMYDGRFAEVTGSRKPVLPIHLEILFRNVRRLDINIHDVRRATWESMRYKALEDQYPKERIGLPHEKDHLEHLLDREERYANNAYNVQQSLANLVNRLRSVASLQSVSIKLLDVSPKDTLWLLEPLACLRKIPKVQIDVVPPQAQDYPESWMYWINYMQLEHARNNSAVNQIAGDMMGSSQVVVHYEDAALNGELIALGEYVAQFDLNFQGVWEERERARKYLFEARVACSNNNRTQFEERRASIVEMWDLEQIRRKAKESEAAKEFRMLEAECRHPARPNSSSSGHDSSTEAFATGDSA